MIVGPALSEAFWPAVGVDDGPGIAAAVEHLAAHGHTRIAHVSGPVEMVHGRSRRDAWAATLRAAGLPEGPSVEADFSAEGGAAATHELLDLAEPPTAIVYANDLMAIAGLAVAARRGIDVPGQLSVTGYDDTELAAHVQPSLTSVAHRRHRLGAGRGDAAARAGRPAPRRDVQLPPPRLVVRGSSGPAPLRTPDQPPLPLQHTNGDTDEIEGSYRNTRPAGARRDRRVRG